jgi:hypothetical protein
MNSSILIDWISLIVTCSYTSSNSAELVREEVELFSWYSIFVIFKSTLFYIISFIVWLI